LRRRPKDAQWFLEEEDRPLCPVLPADHDLAGGGGRDRTGQLPLEDLVIGIRPPVPVDLAGVPDLVDHTQVELIVTLFKRQTC
jgi:hypothetical protein